MDLNQDAGGSFVFLFYHTDGGGPPITGMTILVGEHTEPLPGWKKIPVDLNLGAGGKFLWLAYTTDPNLPPIRAINVMVGGSREQALLAGHVGWHLIDVDCNWGADGKFIYIEYQN